MIQDVEEIASGLKAKPLREMKLASEGDVTLAPKPRRALRSRSPRQQTSRQGHRLRHRLLRQSCVYSTPKFRRRDQMKTELIFGIFSYLAMASFVLPQTANGE